MTEGWQYSLWIDYPEGEGRKKWKVQEVRENPFS